MIQKSIGLILLVAALLALVLALVGGTTTAAFDPFTQMPYYPYSIGLPATGVPLNMPENAGGLPVWLVPALVGVGVAAIGGFVALQLRSHRR